MLPQYSVLQGKCYSHFTDEELEAQRGYFPCSAGGRAKISPYISLTPKHGLIPPLVVLWPGVEGDRGLLRATGQGEGCLPRTPGRMRACSPKDGGKHGVWFSPLGGRGKCWKPTATPPNQASPFSPADPEGQLRGAALLRGDDILSAHPLQVQVGPRGVAGTGSTRWAASAAWLPSLLQATLPPWLREPGTQGPEAAGFALPSARFCLRRWPQRFEPSCQEATGSEEAWVPPRLSGAPGTPSPSLRWEAASTALEETLRQGHFKPGLSSRPAWRLRKGTAEQGSTGKDKLWQEERGSGGRH